MANRNNSVCLPFDCSSINKDGPGRFRTEADKPDFETFYFNVANDERNCNEFVSQCINSSQTDDKIQVKIIHLESKTDNEETVDATEELRDFNKNNGPGTSGDSNKRVRIIFGTSYKRRKIL